jgi:ceramide glucosyltransferase
VSAALHVLAWLLTGLAALGCCYLVLAIVLTRRFARRGAPPVPLAAPPPVTVLKPLHGAPPHLFACLASLCAQDYAGLVQIVLGVQDAADPATAVAQTLRETFPGQIIDLVIDPTRHGTNAKVTNLINMAGHIRHDVVVIADADIVVPPTYLSETVGLLLEPGVGAVTWLYHGLAGKGVWSRLAAAGIELHFLPNLLVGLGLGLPQPALGATIALRRATLDRAGGFTAFADQLADDHALGAAVRRQGGRVAAPHRLVGHVCVEGGWRTLLRHELRWARTVRMLGPAGYAGTLITHPFPLALLGLVAGGGWTAAALVLAALALRIILGVVLARAFAIVPPPAWLVPLRDAMSFAVYVWSFSGSGVEWNGEVFRVGADGTLTPDRSYPRQ